MAGIDALFNSDKPFLTDGGLETWLFFQEGLEAPEFAAIVLTDDPSAQRAMKRYFGGFLELAAQARTGFVLDTNTWRGCTVWAGKLGVSEAGLLDLSRKSVERAKALRDKWTDRVSPILVNGVVGPSGDGYAPGEVPSAKEAQRLHIPQIRALADAEVDMISAITMTNSGEAIGIVDAACDADVPVVVSFTLETDGKLPTGQTLADAIRETDAATGSGPAYYMINCAHPDHFRQTIADGDAWIERVGGIRANASRPSHAELDEAEELDEGDPDEFGELHGELARLLPSLRVVGGCCGTDARHVGCVARTLLAPMAA